MDRTTAKWIGYTRVRYCGTDEYGEPIYRDGVVYRCPGCGRRTVIKENYCPSCGLKMIESEGSHDE